MNTKPNRKTQNYANRALELFSQLPAYHAAERGGFEIEAKTEIAGSSHTVISMRNAIFCGAGLQPVSYKLSHDMTFYYLRSQEHGTWMSTTLQEIGQMAAPLKAARGHVLIGGLGLGAVAHLMLKQPKVKSVTVIEREPELIELVRPFIDKNIDVLQADLHEYVKTITHRKQYDFAFFDIWQSTGEWTWQTHVVPLRRAVRGKIRKVFCWQEDEMQGQLWQGAGRFALMPCHELADSPMTAHRWVFNCALEHWMPEIKKASLAEFKQNFQDIYVRGEELAVVPGFVHLMNFFLDVSHKDWEAVFGKYWDQTLPWYNRELQGAQT